MGAYVRVSLAEFKAIKAKAASRKTKRQERAAELWPKKVKAKASGSLWKYWADRLDASWSRTVRARDLARFGNVCRIRKSKHCSGRSEVAYHIISKSRGHAVRWKLANGVASCSACNLGELMNRVLYDHHHRELFGEDFIAELKRLSHETLKLSVPEMKRMVQDFIRIEESYLTLRAKQAAGAELA